MPEVTFDQVSAIAERLGVVLLLCVVILAIWRKWFVPYYLVDELKARAERAEVDGRYWRDLSIQLMTGASRSLTIAERTAELLVAKTTEKTP